jgi:hypothetical protein
MQSESGSEYFILTEGVKGYSHHDAQNCYRPSIRTSCFVHGSSLPKSEFEKG